MIQTIPFELDGFSYNIIQMSGKQAWMLKLRLLNEFPGVISDLKKLQENDVKNMSEAMLDIVASAFTHIKAEKIIPIVEELLTTIKHLEMNKDVGKIQGNGFDASRHGNLTVDINAFVGKDSIHLPIIVFAILKANYTDFFLQLKQRLGSNFAHLTSTLKSPTPA